MPRRQFVRCMKKWGHWQGTCIMLAAQFGCLELCFLRSFFSSVAARHLRHLFYDCQICVAHSLSPLKSGFQM